MTMTTRGDNPLCRRYFSAMGFLILVGMIVSWSGRSSIFAQEPSLPWQVLEPGPKVSLRGISLVSEKVAWACGSKGTVMRTDGSLLRWKSMQIADWPELEFRSVHAINERNAVIASAGTPAIILTTADGGETWTEVYRHPSPQAFIDGFTFWNAKQGMAISDPIDGKWLILRTEDGGRHWNEVTPSRDAISGEAAFAASSGSLFALDDQHYWLGTGGATRQAQAASYRYALNQWSRSVVPIATNESSGVFAVHFLPSGLGVAVGGDYRQESEGRDSAAWSEDGGATWQPASSMPSGFRSSITHVTWRGKPTWIATGPNGTDVSADGKKWEKASDVGFHAVRPLGNKILAVGSAGRIGVLETALPRNEASLGAVPDLTETNGTRFISGIYPHLTTYAQSRIDGLFHRADSSECGIGAIVPWGGRLWMVTYAPHRPLGSEHKLYSIEPDSMKMTIHRESVGGTPAGRMIHLESKQLFIGHHVIDESGTVRTISPKEMPGRVTAWARHLSDPVNKIYMYDMEGMLYEVEVRTLEVKKLFHNPVPGEHGKGAYTAQGKFVVANNGVSGSHDPKEHWLVKPEKPMGPEDRGILATFDGTKWEIVEQRQFTDVTGPDGISPTEPNLDKPLWAIGWDKRAVRLKVMEQGKFYTYLLPKGCLNNDAAHGWFTEWPRIREIDRGRFLLDMHGLLFDFPADFRPSNSAGISPIARHLRYIPDFCDWNGRLVMATDETSIQGNPLAGQPQSNLWFGRYEDLRTWGEASAAGSIWVKETVKANEPSLPFLINGFARRIVHLAASPGTRFRFELDHDGNDHWTPYQTLQVADSGYLCHVFPEDLKAQWIRVSVDRDSQNVSVAFHCTDCRLHDAAGPGQELFAALANVASTDQGPALHMFPAKQNRNLEIVRKEGESNSFAELHAESFTYSDLKGSDSLKNKAIVKPVFTVDEASVLLNVVETVQGEKRSYRLRLPKGSPEFDQAFAEGWPRSEREVESERTLANIHGTFYEVPFWIVGENPLFSKMKPVCSHNKRIDDFATWRGLLCLSGVRKDAPASEHVIRSDDGKWALWVGGIDDLWKLGKPVGRGGPWRESAVKAGVPSDPYLVNGYDKKRLMLTADRDCVVELEVDFDLQSGFHRYRTWELKQGEGLPFEFPVGFNAHWLRFVCNVDAVVTAWLVYE